MAGMDAQMRRELDAEARAMFRRVFREMLMEDSGMYISPDLKGVTLRVEEDGSPCGKLIATIPEP